MGDRRPKLHGSTGEAQFAEGNGNLPEPSPNHIVDHRVLIHPAFSSGGVRFRTGVTIQSRVVQDYLNAIKSEGYTGFSPVRGFRIGG
jgi:hypothetical protein